MRIVGTRLTSGLTVLMLTLSLTAQAVEKAKPTPTSNPATVIATIGDKKLTWGDLQTLKKFSGAPEGQDQALINMWKVNTVLANKARKANIENNPEVMPLLRIAQDQVLVSIYMRFSQMNLTVTDQEVKEYYEKHKNNREFRELDSVTATLIAADKKPAIDEIKKQLVGGANFEKLAEANRAVTLKTLLLPDIVVKDVPAEQLTKKLGAAVGYSMAGAPLGEVRGPQGIPNGWILYKVTARTPGKSLPLEKLTADLKTMLLRQKRSAAQNALLQEAQKEAGVTLDQMGGLKNNNPRMNRMAPKGLKSLKPRP